ncbi:MAG: hypothetical protein NVS3B21_34340 [Acidimicrobiales bacterium]
MRRLLLVFVLIAGLLLATMGALGVLRSQIPQLPATAVRAQEPIQIIDAAPFNATTPRAIDIPHSAKVDTQGLKIRIPELGINLDIIEGDGIEAPLHKAAHYPGTAWPGEGGRTVLYAHARIGMFGPLFGAKVGQRIQIVHRDGRIHTYDLVEYYSSWPNTDVRWLKATDYEELVLITCTTYNQNDPKIIVVARPSK